MNSDQIINLLIKEISEINIISFDDFYVPSRGHITELIDASIKDTCKKHSLVLSTEFHFKLSEKEQLMYTNNVINCYCDYVIHTTKGRNIAIELDSGLKKWSYNKLNILALRDFDSFWILWKRNQKRNIKNFDFYNPDINVINHTFLISKQNKLTKIILYKEYNCSVSDSCLKTGCPGHLAKLDFNIKENLYELDNGKGKSKFFKASDLDKVIDYLRKLKLT